MSKIKLSEDYIKDRVKLALTEDLFPNGDITTNLLNNNKIVTARLISNQKAIIAGLSGNSDSVFNTSSIFGFLAIALAAINIFGGFLVTQRMLAMYKKKTKDKK